MAILRREESSRATPTSRVGVIVVVVALLLLLVVTTFTTQDAQHASGFKLKRRSVTVSLEAFPISVAHESGEATSQAPTATTSSFLTPTAELAPSAPLPSDEPRMIQISNSMKGCDYTVDNSDPRSSPTPADVIRRCGGLVTGRPRSLPRAIPDPMLACSYETSALYGFNMLYYVTAPPFVQLPRAAAGVNLVHHVFRDWSCYSSYRAPQGHVLFGADAPYDNAEVMLVSTEQLIDVGSTTFVQRYRMKDINIHNGQETFYRVQSRLSSFVPLVREFIATKVTQSLAAQPVDVIDGDAALLPSRYLGAHLIGQVFQEFMTYCARLYTAGVLDRPLTIVIQRLAHRDDDPFRTWLFPFLGEHVRVHEVAPQRIALVERPVFVSVSGTEAVEPCHGLFVSFHVLPAVIKAIRGATEAFPWGNDTMRRDVDHVSDAAWLATLPRMIAILKNDNHARHRRAWVIDAAATRQIEAWGYTVVSDDAPFTHRMLLINAAEVLATNFGALLAMLARLYGGHVHRAAPLRIIVLVHPGYSNEKGWNAPRACRWGVQAGVPVAVTNASTLTPHGTWQKFVYFASEHGHIQATLRRELWSFTSADCDLSTATPHDDFEGTSHAKCPYGHVLFATVNSTWRWFPKYGYRCPLPSD